MSKLVLYHLNFKETNATLFLVLCLYLFFNISINFWASVSHSQSLFIQSSSCFLFESGCKDMASFFILQIFLQLFFKNFLIKF